MRTSKHVDKPVWNAARRLNHTNKFYQQNSTNSFRGTVKTELAVPIRPLRQVDTSRPYIRQTFHQSRNTFRSTSPHHRRPFHRSPSYHRSRTSSPKTSENSSTDTASRNSADFNWRPKPTAVNQISADKKWISVRVEYQDSQERPKSILTWVPNDN